MTTGTKRALHVNSKCDCGNGRCHSPVVRLMFSVDSLFAQGFCVDKMFLSPASFQGKTDKCKNTCN